MISSLATFSWGSLRLRSHVRLGAIVVIALLGAALLSAPWETLSVSALLYLGLIPFSIASYRKARRQRHLTGTRQPQPDEPAPAV